MKLVVGLGNPGKEYENTRHNIGFMILDKYVSDFKVKDNYMYCEKFINNEKVIFVKPLTYVNDSGIAVKKIVDYYKIDIPDILVIHDDMDFDIGTFKLRKSGSSGGHNGIKSIIKHLNSEDFKRLRVGISKNNIDVVSYVLGKFSKEEMSILDKEINTINKLLDDYFVISFDMLMNKYN